MIHFNLCPSTKRLWRTCSYGECGLSADWDVNSNFALIQLAYERNDGKPLQEQSAVTNWLKVESARGYIEGLVREKATDETEYNQMLHWLGLETTSGRPYFEKDDGLAWGPIVMAGGELVMTDAQRQKGNKTWLRLVCLTMQDIQNNVNNAPWVIQKAWGVRSDNSMRLQFGGRLPFPILSPVDFANNQGGDIKSLWIDREKVKPL
jgi:hypothetical protein